jgi:hypothetical protein
MSLLVIDEFSELCLALAIAAYAALLIMGWRSDRCDALRSSMTSIEEDKFSPGTFAGLLGVPLRLAFRSYFSLRSA